MKKNIFSVIAMAILFLAQTATAQIQGDGKAGLVITPTRVELEGKQRSASITIANNGSTRGSYRIQLINKKMTEDGRVLDVTKEDSSEMFADKMLRVSPRSVTLDPGANQSIRILVRKPKDLAEGEYRTHLNVMILPDDVQNEPDKNVKDDKLVIAIKANYGVSIPIIIRNGNVSATGQMSKISYHPASDKKDATVNFSVTRNGNASLYGDVKVVYVKNGGSESVIKFMGGMAIYTPNKKRDFEIPLDADSIKGDGGTIKVIYQEKDKSGGKVIAQNELKL